MSSMDEEKEITLTDTGRTHAQDSTARAVVALSGFTATVRRAMRRSIPALAVVLMACILFAGFPPAGAHADSGTGSTSDPGAGVTLTGGGIIGNCTSPICGSTITPGSGTPPIITYPPADLLNFNQPNCTAGNLVVRTSLYCATPAQAQSLHNLQQQAITNTIQDHGLAQGDGPVVQSWGRSDALAELWALLIQAIKTDPNSRTTDQQNAVDWLASMERAEGVVVAQDAGLEYVKWAGLDQTAYNSLITNSNTTESDLQTFLTGLGTANGGPCGYRSPAPYQDEYTGYTSNYCSATPDPLATGFDSTPPYPTFDQFEKWGGADASNALVSTPDFAALSSSAAYGITFGAAAVGAAVTGVTLSSTLGGVLAGTSVAEALTPFAGLGAAGTAASGGAIAAAGVGGVVAVVILAVVIGVLQGIKIGDDLALPGELANLITNAPSNTPDVQAALNDSQQLQGLYSLFIGAATPMPTSDTCDNTPIVISSAISAECLNATAVPGPASSDSVLAITPQGSTDSTYATSLSWTDTANGFSTTARINGHWFLEQVTPSGSSTPITVEALRMYYTDWSGQERLAWLTGDASSGYKFLDVQDSSSSTPVSPTTCLSDGTCAYSATIQYVGTDGKDYSAGVTTASTPTVTWSAPATITYGTGLGASQLDATATDPSGADVAGIFAYSVDGSTATTGQVLPAGTHTLTVQFTPTDSVKYATPKAVSVSLTVNPAQLTITASDASMTYGGAVPAITPSYSGFVNNETASALGTAPTCGTTATSASPVGSYATTCSATADANYTISYQAGTLTVDPLLTLDEQGLPSTVPHQATLDGQTVTLPDTNVEVAYGSTHSYSFPPAVIDASSGVAYFTTDAGFSGTVTANISDTVSYQTMAQIITTALSSGGIDNRGLATSLAQRFADVQTQIQAGNPSRALATLTRFAADVQRQSDKHITTATAQTLLADAQLVYAQLGGTGSV